MSDSPAVLVLLRVFINGLLMLPVIPIGLAWFRPPAPSGIGRLALVLATLSWAFLLAGVIVPRLIGPDYSPRRYGTIYANLGVMLIAAVLAAARGRPRRRLLVVICLWIGCAWLYALVASSAV